jgi:hypothetical protein
LSDINLFFERLHQNRNLKINIEEKVEIKLGRMVGAENSKDLLD